MFPWSQTDNAGDDMSFLGLGKTDTGRYMWRTLEKSDDRLRASTQMIVLLQNLSKRDGRMIFDSVVLMLVRLLSLELLGHL